MIIWPELRILKPNIHLSYSPLLLLLSVVYAQSKWKFLLSITQPVHDVSWFLQSRYQATGAARKGNDNGIRLTPLADKVSDKCYPSVDPVGLRSRRTHDMRHDAPCSLHFWPSVVIIANQESTPVFLFLSCFLFAPIRKDAWGSRYKRGRWEYFRVLTENNILGLSHIHGSNVAVSGMSRAGRGSCLLPLLA